MYRDCSVTEDIKDFLDNISSNIYLDKTDKEEVRNLFLKIQKQVYLYIKEREKLYSDNKRYRHACITKNMAKEEYRWIVSVTDDVQTERIELITCLCNEADAVAKKFGRSPIFSIESKEDLLKVCFAMYQEMI